MTVKSIFGFTLLLFFSPLYSQDFSIGLASSQDSVKFKIFTFMNSYNFNKEPIIINTEPEYKDALERSGSQAELWVDFDKETVVAFNYRGMDCHSRFRFAMLDDSINMRRSFNITIIYGGCRAGGHSYDSWLIMPKLPEGFTFLIKEYKLDSDPEEKTE